MAVIVQTTKSANTARVLLKGCGAKGRDVANKGGVPTSLAGRPWRRLVVSWWR
jgi:hypothetical protein